MEGLETRSVTVNGHKVVYYSHGTDPKALVFIHGWTCNSQLWHLQSPIYKTYRSILIDLPGHGASEAPSIEHSQETFAHAVHAVLQAEGITKAVLVGHSMGGPVSTMVLRLYPDLVSSIIYVDSFFRLPETYLSRPQRQELAAGLAVDERFKSNLERFWTSNADPKIRSLVTEAMLATPRHVRINAPTTNLLPHEWRYGEVYGIPVLHVATPRYADIDGHWKHHMPGLRMVVYEGAGHFFFLEEAGRFNGDVRGFIEEHGLLERVESS